MNKTIFILLFIILYCWYNTFDTESQFEPFTINNKYFGDFPINKHKIFKNGKIFVSVASYRDPQLIPTIDNMIKMSDYPDKLKIVVCEQNDITDNIALPARDNVEIIRMNSYNARGPCYARYLIQQKYSGEEYYLQIDSHTRFAKSWDTKLIHDLSTLPQLSCLSNYVSTYDITTEEIIVSPVRGPMRVVSWNPHDKFCRFNSKYIKQDLYNKPMKSKGWSGCFSFSSSQIIHDAPYDPNTPFLFFGEEMDIYARLYTRGWNMYVPHRPICFTSFDRSYRKTFWEHRDCKDISKISQKYVYERIFKNKGKEPFKLGTVRTDFLSFISSK